MANVIGIIPARFYSTRLPRKLMLDLQGKSILQSVYENACKAGSLRDVVIATDHQIISDHCTELGMKHVLTSSEHQSGTDRCAEAALLFPQVDYILNIQGDEPFFYPSEIDAFVDYFLAKESEIATLACPIKIESHLMDPSKVKIVLAHDGQALYFSRSPVPYVRNHPKDQWLHINHHYRHIGVYAYKYDTLQQLTKLPMSTLEQMESLEQLRWLDHGYTIHVQIGSYEGIGIDTEDDYNLALQRLQSDIASRE